MRTGQIVSMKEYNRGKSGIMQFNRPYTNEPRTSGFVLKTKCGYHAAQTKKELVRER